MIIDSKKGVSILEIKDWGISYINRANRRKVYLEDKKEVDNPLFKANQYYRAAEDLFSAQDILIGDDGKLRFNMFSNVIFTNLSSLEVEQNNLDIIFNQRPSNYITADMISTFKMEQVFNRESGYIDHEALIMIRTLLFPEIKITKKNKNLSTIQSTATELIKALDTEQERFAKRLPYGHYMVTGVPGSGKTVILLARAIHLLRKNPEWRVKIVTYNKSLKAKIENSLNLIASDLAFMDVRLENIDITTFHKFALNTAGVGVPKNANDKWWNEDLPQMALERIRPVYDAVLIDEYQDFYDDWIRLCIKSCIRYSFIDNKKEKKEGINLFLAGDRLQSIYNKREASWKEIGIDMRGRSQLLKKSYRSGNEHIDLALNFLKQNKALEDEVKKFYSPMDEMTFENHVQNGVSFVDGSNVAVSKIINELIYKLGYKPEDILVLCKNWKTCNEVKDSLDEGIRRKTEVTRNITGGKLVITTYHSAKGLEAPITFLIDVHKFENKSLPQNDIQERKLLYVGMTRASERLYVHASDYSSYSFASTLKDIALQPV